MFRSDVVYAAARQVAADYGCTVFDLEEDRVTVREMPASSERLRGITSDLRAVTFGRGTVINTRIELIPFAKKLAESDGLSLFDGAGIAAINSGLKPFGGMISSIKLYYLPDELTESRTSGIKLRVFEKDEIPSIYSPLIQLRQSFGINSVILRQQSLPYAEPRVLSYACTLFPCLTKFLLEVFIRTWNRGEYKRVRVHHR